MKEIKLASHIFFHPTDEAEVDYDVAVQHTIEARRNANKVISGALYVEREMEAIIDLYLHPSQESTEQRTFLRDQILRSDALSFANKLRLVLAVVEQKGWYVGKTKSALESQLRQVMSFRNAFAHGDVIEKGEETVLEYYEGKRRTHVLTDEFWDKLVKTFESAAAEIEHIKASFRDSTSPPHPAA